MRAARDYGSTIAMAIPACSAAMTLDKGKSRTRRFAKRNGLGAERRGTVTPPRAAVHEAKVRGARHIPTSVWMGLSLGPCIPPPLWRTLNHGRSAG